MPMEQAPAAQAPQEQAPAQGGGQGQVQELLSNINTGLSMLSEMLAEANPELGQQAQALVEGFNGLVDALMGGQQAQAPSGPVPMEAGAQGVPMNPAQK